MVICVVDDERRSRLSFVQQSVDRVENVCPPADATYLLLFDYLDSNLRGFEKNQVAFVRPSRNEGLQQRQIVAGLKVHSYPLSYPRI